MRRYIIASEWEHIFEDETVICRFVYDTDEELLVATNIKRGRRWLRATNDQHADIEDSVIHGQVDAIAEHYRDFGMTSCATVPDWAVPVRERVQRQEERRARRRSRLLQGSKISPQLSFEGV